MIISENICMAPSSPLCCCGQSPLHPEGKATPALPAVSPALPLSEVSHMYTDHTICSTLCRLLHWAWRCWGPSLPRHVPELAPYRRMSWDENDTPHLLYPFAGEWTSRLFCFGLRKVMLLNVSMKVFARTYAFLSPKADNQEWHCWFIWSAYV